MRIFATIWLSVLATLLLVGPVSADSGEGESEILAVIVHRDNPVDTLSGVELEAIFMSRRRHWQGGKNIVAFNFPPRQEHRVAFDRAVLRMTPDEVGRFWINQRIRGRRGPPRSVPSESLMVRVVERLPTAIGYVPLDRAKKNAVKIIALVKENKVLPPP